MVRDVVGRLSFNNLGWSSRKISKDEKTISLSYILIYICSINLGNFPKDVLKYRNFQLKNCHLLHVLYRVEKLKASKAFIGLLHLTETSLILMTPNCNHCVQIVNLQAHYQPPIYIYIYSFRLTMKLLLETSQ